MKAQNLVLLGVGVCMMTACNEPNSGIKFMSYEECSICHELPPRNAAHEVHVKRESYNCGPCHEGTGVEPYFNNDATHGNGEVDVIFSERFDSGAVASYNPASYTCSNLYCHGTFPGGTNASVSFPFENAIAGRCGECHALPGMLSGHHDTVHVDTIRNCERCHAGYSIIDSTVVESTHVDGITQATACCSDCHDDWERSSHCDGQ